MRQTSIFDEPNPTPPKRPKLIRIMSWFKEPGGEWVAKGDKGDFRLWRRGGVWKGRYASYDDRVFFYMCSSKNVQELKERCERNRYWEK